MFWRMGGLAAAFLFFIQVFLLPLPEPAIRGLVSLADEWILSDYEKSSGSFSAVQTSMRRLVATLIEQSLINRFEKQIDVPVGQSELDRLVYSLSSLKDLLINQGEVFHPPSIRPTFLSGLGWCDQLNGVAGKMLASRFSISQTYGLYDPKTGRSPHTIGRVWSQEYGGWLWFDIFYDEIFVFQREAGVIKILARVRPLQSSRAPPPNDQDLENLYQMIEQGWVLNDYAGSFGGLLVKKIRQALLNRTLVSLVPVAPIFATAPDTTIDNSLPKKLSQPGGAPDADKKFRSLYLKARLPISLGINKRLWRCTGYQDKSTWMGNQAMAIYRRRPLCIRSISDC